VLGLPYATIIGKVSGGEWASTVIDRVVAEGRYGVKLGQTWRDAERDLQRCIDDANESDPILREHPATVELTGGRFSSARIPADHPLPPGLAAVARATLARSPAGRGAGLTPPPVPRRPVPGRAVRRRHAPAGERGRDADRHLRPTGEA